MRWIQHRDVSDALVVDLLVPGLLAGEALERASYGGAPTGVADLRRAATWLKDRAVAPFAELRPRDAVTIAAGVGAGVVADSVLHAFGAIAEHESMGDAAGAGPHERDDEPPSHHGYVLALTSSRVLLLDVWSVARQRPGVAAWDCFFAVAGAWAWPRPPAQPGALRFRETRVLWERQLELVAATRDGERLVRFSSYGFADARERGLAIAHALGIEPRTG